MKFQVGDLVKPSNATDSYWSRAVAYNSLPWEVILVGVDTITIKSLHRLHWTTSAGMESRGCVVDSRYLTHYQSKFEVGDLVVPKDITKYHPDMIVQNPLPWEVFSINLSVKMVAVRSTTKKCWITRRGDKKPYKLVFIEKIKLAGRQAVNIPKSKLEQLTDYFKQVAGE